MKLNTNIRAVFVRSAMDDVPKTDYSTLIQDEVNKGIVDLLPKEVRSIWQDPKLRGFIFVRGYTLIAPREGGRSIYKVVITPVSPIPDGPLRDKLIALAEKEVQEVEKRLDLRTKLEAAACSVNTVEQLKKLLPEMAHYLPDEKAPIDRSVPAVANLMTDLTKAGWPKDKKLEPEPEPTPAPKKARKGKVTAS